MVGLDGSIWADPEFDWKNIGASNANRRSAVNSASLEARDIHLLQIDPATVTDNFWLNGNTGAILCAKGMVSAVDKVGPQQAGTHKTSSMAPTHPHIRNKLSSGVNEMRAMFSAMKISSASSSPVRTIVDCAATITATGRQTQDTSPNDTEVKIESTKKPAHDIGSSSNSAVCWPEVLAPLTKMCDVAPSKSTSFDAALRNEGSSASTAPSSTNTRSAFATTMYQGKHQCEPAKSTKLNAPTEFKVSTTAHASFEPAMLPKVAKPAKVAMIFKAGPLPALKAVREGFNEEGLPILFRGKAAIDPELQAFNESLTKGPKGKKQARPHKGPHSVPENKLATHSTTKAQPVKQIAASAVANGQPKRSKEVSNNPNAKGAAESQPMERYRTEKAEMKELMGLRARELVLEQQLVAIRKKKAKLSQQFAKKAGQISDL